MEDDDSPVFNVELLSLSSVEPHLRGVIRTKWDEKKLELCKSRTEQMMALWDNVPSTAPKENWFISLNTLALAFNLHKMQVKRMIERKKSTDSGIAILPNHRPPKITPKQLDLVKEFIRKREVDKKDPPEISEVCEFILLNFGISYQSSWINSIVKKSKGIFIVDAQPLEDERIDVKVEDLRSNHEKLSELLKTTDPRLLVNIDESGWGKKLKCGEKCVVSLNNTPTTYCEKLAEGHITAIPVSWANGEFSRSMLVIQTKTIERSLLPLGIPDGPNALVTASTKGYIMTEGVVKNTVHHTKYFVHADVIL